MSDAAYFNLHGEPMALSARDAVLSREPLAYAESRKLKRYGVRRPVLVWFIYKTRSDGIRRASDRQVVEGGASEESAWRQALSVMRIKDNEEAAKA